jgi:methylated-DNA-[protein]-cysteine S-methyltransferase
MTQALKKGSGSRPGPFSGWRRQCTPFQRTVYEAVLTIPSGQVRTYAEVARAIGRPKAARAVGQALKRNRWAPAIPCHRVVASDGSLGGYTAPGGVARKRRFLRQEGALRA